MFFFLSCAGLPNNTWDLSKLVDTGRENVETLVQVYTNEIKKKGPGFESRFKVGMDSY